MPYYRLPTNLACCHWFPDADEDDDGGSTDAEIEDLMAMGVDWVDDEGGDSEDDSEDDDEFDEELNDWADWMEAEADALSQSSDEPGG